MNNGGEFTWFNSNDGPRSLFVTQMQNKDTQDDIDPEIVKFQHASEMPLHVAWSSNSSEATGSLRNSKQILAEVMAKGLSKQPTSPLIDFNWTHIFENQLGKNVCSLDYAKICYIVLKSINFKSINFNREKHDSIIQYTNKK